MADQKQIRQEPEGRKKVAGGIAAGLRTSADTLRKLFRGKRSKEADGGRRAKARKAAGRRGRRSGTLFPRQGLRWSLILPASILVGYSAVSVLRLFSLSVVQNRFYTERAASQHIRRSVIYPERGRILDANGKVLAETTYIYTVGVTPRDIKAILDDHHEAGLEQIAKKVAEILQLDEKDVYAKFQQTEETYIQLKKEVPRETKDKLDKYLKKYLIGGFAIDPVARRYYPEGSYLSNVVGFTSTQDRNPKGILGVEYSYNNELTGTPGYAYTQVDNYLQSQLPNSQAAHIAAKDGSDVVLTIDEDIQRRTQEITEWLRDVTNAELGTMALVIDAQTGEVLAMAGGNSFDLNHPNAAPPNKNPKSWDPSGNQEDLNYLMSEVWRNKVISEPYEPGSIMKPFTLGISMDEGQVDLNEYLSDEPLQMGDWTAYKMSCWAQQYGFNHGMETIQEALMRSCNPPFAILAQRVGIQNFYDYVHRLGFSEMTDIDLPAESVGLIHSKPSVTDLCTIAIGEQSTVSMIRMGTIYAAMANGGEIIKPHVMKRIQSRDGTVIRENTPEVVRHIFSESITKKVREMMIPGTHYPEGSGPRIYAPGLLSGGKTGTSQDNEDTSRVCYSTAMITPYDYPEFIVLTAALVPRADTDSKLVQIGARMIARKAAEVKHLKARFNEYDIGRVFSDSYVQNYVGYSYFQAASDAAINRDVRVVAPSGTRHNEQITEQYPPSGEPIYSDSVIYVGTANHPIPEDWKRQVEVPNFVGLTYFEAIQLADRAELNLAISGSDPESTVSYQSVAGNDQSGKKNYVRKGSVISLIFDGQAEPQPQVGVGVDIWKESPQQGEAQDSKEAEASAAANAWQQFDADLPGGATSSSAQNGTESAPDNDVPEAD